MAKRTLTGRQIQFCKQYIIDFNATQAAIRAGYSKKTAYAIGNENMLKPNIQAYIQEISKKIDDKLQISAERVKQELARVALSDIRKFYDENGHLKPIDQLDEDAAAAIAGIEVEKLFGFRDGDREQIGNLVKIKRYDKVKALELLGRIFGIFEKDNEQSRTVVTPYTDVQVNMLIAKLENSKPAA